MFNIAFMHWCGRNCTLSYNVMVKDIVTLSCTVTLQSYHNHIHSIITHVLHLATAFTFLQFANVEDNFECSTSAVDVVNCYTQVGDVMSASLRFLLFFWLTQLLFSHGKA